MCKAYKAYFGIPVGDQFMTWAPHFVCGYCKKTLEGKKKTVSGELSDLTIADITFIAFDKGISNSFLF